MKVRFSSTKERQPDRENGLRVLYGPGKRLAYRLRWYLILALVASPLVFIFGRLLLDALRLEAPAQLAVPTTDVRALESGTIQQLAVQAGQRVEPGQLLVRLDNPEWRLRLNQLEPADLRADDTIGRAAEGVQASTITLQGQMVELFRGLNQQGGISSAELLQAEVELNRQRLALLELDRQLQQDRFQVRGRPIENLRDQRERRWIANRLGLLTQRSDVSGRVGEVLVNQGENVGPGTLLMRIERAEEPLLWIYLKPRFASEAQPGQIVEVKMPDGSWLEARVLQQPDLARRLPPGLRSSVANDGLALQVPARFVQPLPLQWRVDQLPLTARFPHGWLR